MELDSLPDNVLLNILSNLDLQQLVRNTRVCQRWHDICQLVLETELEHLNLSDRSYWRLNTDSLAWILRLSSQRLRIIELPTIKPRSVKLPNGSKSDSTAAVEPYVKLNVARWCQVLSEFRFANLHYLNLGDATTDRNCVESILASNQSLEVFRWLTPDPNGLEFGDLQRSTWTSSALREVNLGCLFATDALFSTLARNCPKLERFTANSYFRQWTAAGFDRFCGACRRLKVLNLKVSNSLEITGIYVVPLLFDPPKLATDLTNFWSLRQLRYLSLPFEGGLFDDEALYRISLSFPELRVLKFGDSRLSSEGVAHLARLPNLKCLTMVQVVGSIDEGLLRVAAENRLKELNLALTLISFPTLLALLRHCTGLRCLNLSRSVSNYQVHRGTNISVEQALQMIELRRRMIEVGDCVSTCTMIHTDPAVWTSTSVRTALQKVPAGGIETFRIVSLSDYCQAKCGDDEESYESLGD